MECQILIYKITGRLAHWSSRLLSYAGRLNSIQVYWAGIFILPKSITTKIKKLCRDFLWCGTSDKKRISLLLGKNYASQRRRGT